MKKITLKLSIVMMVIMAMVSCKKDITDELEASNREALSSESIASNYYIDSIIVNDGGDTRILKFDYDVANKSVNVYLKETPLSSYVLYVNYLYNNNWKLIKMDNIVIFPDDFLFNYSNTGYLSNIRFNSVDGIKPCEEYISANNKPSSFTTPRIYTSFFGLPVKYKNNYTYNYGNLTQISSSVVGSLEDNNTRNFTYFGNVNNPFKNLNVPVDYDSYLGSHHHGINPSLLLKIDANVNLPFNFTSNRLAKKLVKNYYIGGVPFTSTLNTVVHSKFLNLPLHVTVSGNLPEISNNYNADITFSYKTIQ